MTLFQVKGTMTSEARREALNQLHNMESEMKVATERLKEMKEEKELERTKERTRQKIVTPGSVVKTPKRTQQDSDCRMDFDMINMYDTHVEAVK